MAVQAVSGTIAWTFIAAGSWSGLQFGWFLLNHLSQPSRPQSDGGLSMPVVILYIPVIVLMVACWAVSSIGVAYIGYGLMKRRQWARVAAIVVAVATFCLAGCSVLAVAYGLTASPIPWQTWAAIGWSVIVAGFYLTHPV